MRKLVTVIAVILLIAGLVFVGRGSGYFPHPAESFMINQTRRGSITVPPSRFPAFSSVSLRAAKSDVRPIRQYSQESA